MIISGKLGQRGFPIGVSLSFEFHERLEADASMGTHPAVVDLSFIDTTPVGSAKGERY